MFDRNFLSSKLGKASCACVTAMCLFVAISTQMNLTPASAYTASEAEGMIGIVHMVELA
ncbi:MAG: hypothetical protein WA908_02350 [Pontixanthobacter sp.]